MLIMNLVKKLFALASGLFTYLTLPVFAYAATVVDPCTNSTGFVKTLCNLGGNNIGQTIRNIVVFMIIIAVLVALIYLLYGGIKWITSRGEKTEVEAARNHIMAAVIGLIVVFLAVFILSVVLAAFGIDFADLIIPNIGSATPAN